MKKTAFFIFIMCFSFISSDTLAEWTIPGGRCIPSEQKGNILFPFAVGNLGYTHSSIVNNNMRYHDIFTGAVEVLCSSTIYHSYGSKLDMDFIAENESRDSPLTCVGYSLDIKGKIVRETETVTVFPGLHRKPAAEIKKHSDAKAVTVVARCVIPDRGFGGRDFASRLIGVRVY